MIISFISHERFFRREKRTVTKPDGVERGSVDTFCVATIKINSEKKKLCFDNNGVNNRGGVTICAHILVR